LIIVLFALIRKNRHRLNKIAQASEVNLRRLNRYLHLYTFLQLTLLTSFAVGRFLCANNKPFAFKELLIHIQRTSFNSVLKQSF
jgi:sorbitol-specific phosphotransferase system component IIC